MGLYKNIALFLSFEKSFKENVNIELIGKITSIPEKNKNIIKYNIKIIENSENFKIKNKKFIVYVKNDEKYNPGDIVFISGIIKKSDKQRNLYGFDYNKYLKSQKIYGIIEIEKIEYLKTKKDFVYIIGSAKRKIFDISSKIYNEKYEKIVNKLLFGSKEKIDEKIQENFKNAGLSHVLAISGLHISYIILFFNSVLKKIIKNIKFKNIIICIFLIFFIIFTDFSASCMRACIMNIFMLLAKNIYRKSNIYVNICIAFIFIIFNNIYSIFDVGMWLSFLGTLGIVLFYDFFKLFIVCKNKENTFRIQSIILVSCSAQLLIWPIVLYAFNTISLTFFISNLLVSNLIGIIILLGYASSFVSFFFLPLGKILGMIEELGLDFLCEIVKICGNLPFSKIYIKGKNLFIMITYYTAITLGIYYFKKNKLRFFRKTIYIRMKLKNGNFKIDELEKIGKRLLILIIITMFLINSFPKNEFELYFVDVGQGDCTIIKTFKKAIIIDGGEGNSDKYDYGKNVLLQHLLKLGIKQIDYMIFSHFDSDHAGGLIHILNNLKVKNIVIGLQAESSSLLEDVIRIAKDKKIKIIVLEAGKILNLDTDFYIEVLWPKSDELISENVLNNNSLVFRLNYKEISILYTGDIEKLAEKKIIEKYGEELKSTFLKVGHHGSKTSTTLEFIKCVLPKIAFIGVGKENKFGHPNEIIIENLKKFGTKIYRTDENGEIILKYNKGKYNIMHVIK